MTANAATAAPAPDSRRARRHADGPARRRRRRNLATTGLVLALAGGAVVSTWSGFVDTTDNAGNTFSTASVSLTDNDTGTYAMFRTASNVNAAGLLPGDTVTECIGVTYTSDVRAGAPTPSVALWVAGVGGDLADEVNVTITRGDVEGAPSWPGSTCGDGFTADTVGELYDGTLTAFAAAYPGGDPFTALDTGAWSSNASGETHYFQVVAEIADTAAQGESVDPFTLAWTSDTN